MAKRRATHEDLSKVPDTMVAETIDGELIATEGDHWMAASAHGGTDVVRAEPFDAIKLRLARWCLEG